MKLEHSAIDEKGFAEKSLSVEILDNGIFKVTAKEKSVGKKEEKTIGMKYAKY